MSPQEDLALGEPQKVSVTHRALEDPGMDAWILKSLFSQDKVMLVRSECWPVCSVNTDA